MKGITGYPALEAYQRVALTPVSPTRAAAPATAAEVTPQSAAKLSISAEARDLATQGETPVNSKKVDAMKAALRDGSFNVDSRLVAERLVDTLG
ncbi:MAG: flagellar biosynthesis anti-sigma factor FlgM [Deltaproteobacteria bacterium]|nr:flagellar biosynthesis anti-sigma factor FlgM [Deltaproteobacteria bacterium]